MRRPCTNRLRKKTFFFNLVPSSEETFLTTFYGLYFSHHYTDNKSCWTFCVLTIELWRLDCWRKNNLKFFEDIYKIKANHSEHSEVVSSLWVLWIWQVFLGAVLRLRRFFHWRSGPCPKFFPHLIFFSYQVRPAGSGLVKRIYYRRLVLCWVWSWDADAPPQGRIFHFNKFSQIFSCTSAPKCNLQLKNFIKKFDFSNTSVRLRQIF